MAPRTSRVTGRTAARPDAGESRTVAPTAPAVVALRIIRSLEVSSASGSRPTPARSNAASSAARSVPVTGMPSCRAVSTRASSGPSAARNSSPRERGFAPSVWSSRIAAASRPTSAGTTSSWIAQANRCASAGIIAGSWVVGVDRVNAPVSSAQASTRSACDPRVDLEPGAPEEGRHEVVDGGLGERSRVGVGVEVAGQLGRPPHPRRVQDRAAQHRRGIQPPPGPVVDPPRPLEEATEPLDRPAAELVVAGAAVPGEGVVGLGRELHDVDRDRRPGRRLVADRRARHLELEQGGEQRRSARPPRHPGRAPPATGAASRRRRPPPAGRCHRPGARRSTAAAPAAHPAAPRTTRSTWCRTAVPALPAVALGSSTQAPLERLGHGARPGVGRALVVADHEPALVLRADDVGDGPAHRVVARCRSSGARRRRGAASSSGGRGAGR